MNLLLAFTCLVVGFLCGCTSIGGILLIPVIQYCIGLDLAQASATGLASFFFTAIIGGVLYWRNGYMQKNLIVPQCIGAVIFACIGALAKHVIGGTALNIVFSLLVIFSGVIAFSKTRAALHFDTDNMRFRYLLFVGCFVGFMAGLTGAGGPVLSVPMMLAAGFAPLPTIAASQPFQLVAAFSGTVGNVMLDLVSWELVFWVTLLEGVGIVIGVSTAKRMNAAVLKIIIAILCILTGCFTLIRPFFTA